MNELARLQTRHLRDHHRQEGVRGNIERHPEKEVGRALVELAGEASLCDIELEEGVARCERHPVEFANVPGTDEQPAGVWLGADRGDHLAQLVDRPPIGGRPGSPLRTVDRTEISLLVSPFIPDGHAVCTQRGDIGLSPQEPEQLVEDRFEMDPLGRHQGKPSCQVEA